jgi:cbb3-type cytochrome oxidase cytochrome c subunit
MRSQSEQISQRLEAEGITGMQDKELVALISYLQRLGKQPPQLLAGNP